MRKRLDIITVVALLVTTVLSCSAKSEPEKKEERTKLTILVCGNSMLYYGGIVQYGAQKYADPGMLSKMLGNGGIEAKVIDCTYGGHHLKDFTEKGCIYDDAHGSDGKKSSGGCPGLGTDLIGGIDLASVDYCIISEAGNNYSSFYSDAEALFNRVKSANPKVKLVYINHIYSVYKNHSNVLGRLKDLHDNLGVDIVNCGQLGYDIYTGAVKVPGGSLTYSDRYTFCNHKDSDTYHPNPLMGYIMTQMTYCLISGKKAVGTDWNSLLEDCKYAGGSTTLGSYYSTYYTTSAALPFTTVLDNASEMKGIQDLIPKYINRY